MTLEERFEKYADFYASRHIDYPGDGPEEHAKSKENTKACFLRDNKGNLAAAMDSLADTFIWDFLNDLYMGTKKMIASGDSSDAQGVIALIDEYIWEGNPPEC